METEKINPVRKREQWRKEVEGERGGEREGGRGRRQGGRERRTEGGKGVTYIS